MAVKNIYTYFCSYFFLGAYLFGMFDSYKPMSPDNEILRSFGAFLIFPLIIMRESGIVPNNKILIWPIIIFIELVWVFLLIKISNAIYSVITKNEKNT